MGSSTWRIEVFGDTQENVEIYYGCGSGGRIVILSGGVVVSGCFERKCYFDFCEESFFEKEPLEGQRIESLFVVRFERGLKWRRVFLTGRVCFSFAVLNCRILLATKSL